MTKLINVPIKTLPNTYLNTYDDEKQKKVTVQSMNCSRFFPLYIKNKNRKSRQISSKSFQPSKQNEKKVKAI